MDTFLPATAPPSATAHRIDFTQTTPPLPPYRHLFAAIIDNVFTEAECTELLRLAEASTLTATSQTPQWERAMLNVGAGEQVLRPDTRNCGRIILDAPELAQKLGDRILPFLRDEFGLDVLEKDAWRVTLQTRRRYQLTRLNERLRFLRYQGGEFFRPHWDGWYTTPDRRERSFFTVHVYLNGEGEGDEGLVGGATSFVRRLEVEREEDEVVKVLPKVGSVLVFQQNDLLHAGEPVVRGVKYTLRTDVMYSEILEGED
ncbi:hypothetical protein ASPACDRAFT_123463 [Aspergillus aculeatus ATCC 16872]|uniref:Prolyl 4-hydroxylase alpha subunit domain-containing protein n=1 Tax=Aspergillus aculeatus (strain ATCC 16872 / CBS 172.66 / WB 5094) TaxID=690307 RepID=A0A1L9WMX6_ASPA1|nr:uncharacterized protein ASPACDRAFT_123463 [Aspergillus aculeatus ATCC 16872]OJJ97532.1 hypothetical protein ASPACDRAFT_123463 [Aspergillus aculeatus ATCC 16872]